LTALRAKGLTKRYDGTAVVDALDLSVGRGELYGFLGPNGAGKTTTIRMALGLIRPSGGDVEVLGSSVTQGTPPLERVGALVEEPAFWKFLSGASNLEYFARAGGRGEGTRERLGRIGDVLEIVGLADAGAKRVKAYSQGMRQRLGIGLAMLGAPDLLVLDEPTNGLDPQGIRDVRALLRQLAHSGKTILVSSHLLSEIEHICDQLLVIRDGNRVFSGPMADVEQYQHSELVVRPDHPDDLVRLSALLDRYGYPCWSRGGEIRVAGADQAAAINVLAFRAGITLAELRSEREGLEATFFRMMEERAA
jgi:ABC-2 type transport system ATP-binding protein